MAMSLLASPVLPAFCRVIDSSSSREAAVSSRVAACSEADSERFWAISFDWPTASPIFTRMLLTDCANCPSSSFDVDEISWVRSPSATCCRTSMVARSREEIIRVMNRLTATEKITTRAATTMKLRSMALNPAFEALWFSLPSRSSRDCSSDRALYMA